jgi:hypothetical protein
MLSVSPKNGRRRTRLGEPADERVADATSRRPLLLNIIT